MKLILLVTLVSLALGAIPLPGQRSSAPEPIKEEEVFGDTEPEEELDEDQFEIEFGLEPITDPVEKQRRQDALEKAEKAEKEQNEKFLNGKSDFWEKINEWSDLPEDEFEKEKAGARDSPSFARGLLEPEVKPVDEESERYFSSVRLDRRRVPKKYDAVKKGLVSEVKNQKQCGSCVAFASMAAIETCFKKKTGVFGDFSEQQLVDCGYQQNGANGCNGAPSYAYIQYVADSKLALTHESTYPYLNDQPTLTCPVTEPYNIGAAVSGSYYTYSGDEDLLKKLVSKHGAVVTSVAAAGPFSSYGGGVFSGCTTSSQDHAVTVVGYGTTEQGEDYWLIKNSWGSDWGEEGFIRLKRGVGMCGVGEVLAVPKCEKVSGATSAPLTTAKPCVDKYSNCPSLAATNCHSYGEHCAKSCGLCDGLTPHPTNTCWDEFSNCPSLAETSCYRYKSQCCLSCGLGEGMEPAASVDCYDTWSNCPDLCSWYPDQCKKSCGLC